MAVTIRVVRFVVMATVILFALVALGVAVALLLTGSIFFIPFTSYAALAIASGVLTLLTLPAMIFFEIIKPNRPTSRTVVEIIWLGVLSILWLATGAVVELSSVGFFGCDVDNTDDFFDIGDAIGDPVTCQENSVIEAFAFMNGIILIVYVVSLIVVSLVASRRKNVGVNASASSSTSAFKDPMPTSYVSHFAVDNASDAV
ncbi:hypothetical protein MSAN_01194800 [Mycena sanguinolenta]|uniref:MARVEL domain-containing protein n=1 Tax=Mycena sanguinolenta TaxID=230812 RepID=A0A8H6YHU7_9AGAR|nr:hypothetical protein MSAN_01194800 [Mycena sanguinolenta]